MANCVKRQKIYYPTDMMEEAANIDLVVMLYAPLGHKM